MFAFRMCIIFLCDYILLRINNLKKTPRGQACRRCGEIHSCSGVMCTANVYKLRNKSDVYTLPRASNNSSPELFITTSNTKQNQSMKLLS